MSCVCLVHHGATAKEKERERESIMHDSLGMEEQRYTTVLY